MQSQGQSRWKQPETTFQTLHATIYAALIALSVRRRCIISPTVRISSPGLVRSPAVVNLSIFRRDSNAVRPARDHRCGRDVTGDDDFNG